MKATIRLFLLLFSFINVVSFDAYGATYYNVSSSPVNLPFEKVAYAQISKHASSLGWDKVKFEYSVQIPLSDSVIVHFQQYSGNYPVYGRFLSAEVKYDGRVVRIWGNPYLTLSTDDSPLVAPEEAVLNLENSTGLSLPSKLDYSLVIMPLKKGVLAYKFNVYQGFKLWILFADAHTGKPIAVQRGWYDVKGRVYLLDPARTPDATDVELTGVIEDATTLAGPFGTVVNCVTASADQMGMPDVNTMETEPILPSDATGNYLYEPVLDLDYTEFAGAINLYYHVGRMSSHFKDDLGYVQPIPVLVVSNMHSQSGSVNQPLDNAFYSPYGPSYEKDGLFVGQGTNVDLSYGGDVVMHEFTHSVISHVAIGIAAQTGVDQYGFNRMPLGIHEGLADYFPTSLNDDPVMGAYALEMLQPGASRDVSNNNKVCPDDMTGEEHADGEILSAAMWLARTVIGAERADELVYAALVRLDANSTFKDFYDALVVSLSEAVNAGTITSAESDEILAHAQSKGLDICGRYLPLDEKEQKVTVMGLDDLGAYMGADCSQMRSFFAMNNIDLPTLFQYKIHIPEGTTQLTFNLNFQAMGDDLSYRVYGRAEEMVTYSLSTGIYGITITTIDAYDKVWPVDQQASSALASYTWNIYDDPPLPVGKDVFFSVTIENCPSSRLTVGAELSSEEIENPDAGTDTSDDTVDATDTEDTEDSTEVTSKSSSDGCSCSSVGNNGSSSVPYLFLFLPAFVLLRRRYFK